MLKYLVILLDDTSTSYCHYENQKTEQNLIALDDLKSGILYAMKENLMIQFVYPKYELPQKYKDVINTIDHTKIVPYGNTQSADVIVLNDWESILKADYNKKTSYVLRTSKSEFFSNYLFVKQLLSKVSRLNVVIKDIETFTEEDFNIYRSCLSVLSNEIEKQYVMSKNVQLNLLTDRIMLTAMNNCNAGWESIALAPNGKFYACPAFYQTKCQTAIDETDVSIGDLHQGVNIKNPQLYKLSHAPLCRNCDAYHCKRCVWLNRKTTFEINTPGHEQCVVAHIERNVSRELLTNVRKHGTFMPEINIKEIDYLDPFEVKEEY